MNLYMLQRADQADYEETEGFIIRAASPIEAREIAASNCGNEGPEFWMGELVIGGLIGTSADKSKGVLMRNFRNTVYYGDSDDE